MLVFFWKQQSWQMLYLFSLKLKGSLYMQFILNNVSYSGGLAAPTYASAATSHVCLFNRAEQKSQSIDRWFFSQQICFIASKSLKFYCKQVFLLEKEVRFAVESSGVSEIDHCIVLVPIGVEPVANSHSLNSQPKRLLQNHFEPSVEVHSLFSVLQ